MSGICWCKRSVISDDPAETLCRYHALKRWYLEHPPLTEAELIAAERAEWTVYRERENERYATEFAARYN